MSGAKLNVKFKIKREKKKPKRCKERKCNKALRSENGSGYCHMHRSRISSRIYSKRLTQINFKKEIHNRFKEYCIEKGFIMSKKAGIILNDFLEHEKNN